MLRELGIPFRERETLWFAADARERRLLAASARRFPARLRLWESGSWLEQAGRHFEAVMTEPGFEFDLLDLGSQLSGSHAPTSIDRLLGIDKAGALEYQVRTETAGREKTERFSLVILATERLDPRCLPFLADKWIPVTLPSFTWPRADGTGFALAFFNGGADFAVGGEGSFRLGSFRNLYADKAVGIHSEVDPASLRGVSTFFGDLGWIDPLQPFQSHLSVEALSCDGLPIAGALADLPGVYLVGAFAGRSANFFFEVAEQLALGISAESGYSGLNLFSTKRFL
jgi:hypothetical protein